MVREVPERTATVLFDASDTLTERVLRSQSRRARQRRAAQAMQVRAAGRTASRAAPIGCPHRSQRP